MNLNITPVENIVTELSSIDAFLNITMSEQIEEAILRGNDLAVYIARTGKLLADAKYHLNAKKKQKYSTPYETQQPELEQLQKPSMPLLIAYAKTSNTWLIGVND